MKFAKWEPRPYRVGEWVEHEGVLYRRVDDLPGRDTRNPRDAGECWEIVGTAAMARQLFRYRSAVKAIVEATDPEPPTENYRQDDREGCLDYVYARASRALKADKITQSEDEETEEANDSPA